ncbi:MAG: YkgJ family cysteine cluster protein [Lachnospiraceae bacterium]|nr:YkgJ family cysteine cluster protein [Lachnospiraceae bacterium]
MIFPCDRCGICCQHIDVIPELEAFDSGTGRCIHLLDNNLCGIYETRPDICNVEAMYKKVYSLKMSEDDYIRLNTEGCGELKRIYGT